MVNSVGLIELSSIASGFKVTDAMLKSSSVDPLISRTICSGKFIVMVSGNVGDVNAAVEKGIEVAQESYIQHFVIPNVHNEVLSAIGGNVEFEKKDAIGILESFSVAALIEGADGARKASNIKLIELRVAMALGGKAFVLFTGSVADVTAGVDAGAEIIGKYGMLVNKVVISGPHERLYEEII